MNRNCVLAVLSVSLCAAQTAVEFEGELEAAAGASPGRLSARLDGMGGATPPAVAQVGWDGRFRFRDVSAGSYTLHIIDEYGDEIAAQPVTVSPLMATLSIRLPERTVRQPVGGTVSVARLRHKPPAKARRAYDRAAKLSQAGEWERAAAELEQAVAVDPEFEEARNDLGTQYARLGRYAEAVVQFRLALEIDPDAALPRSNLAYVLIQLRQFDASEEQVRRAPHLDPMNIRAHYVLGCVLAQRPETRTAAIGEFRSAAPHLPQAHLALAAVYEAMGKQQSASSELELYRKAVAAGGQRTAPSGPAAEHGTGERQ